LPNVLSNGVRRIERRPLATGAVVAYVKDSDGLWPSGANTVNPAGGTREITLAATDVGQLPTGVSQSANVPAQFTISQNCPNPLNPATAVG
jgi:hypothetical protein